MVKEVDDRADEEGERRAVIEAAAVIVEEWSNVDESSEEDRRESFIGSISAVCRSNVEVEQEVRKVPMLECADIVKSPRNGYEGGGVLGILCVKAIRKMPNVPMIAGRVGLGLMMLLPMVGDE